MNIRTSSLLPQLSQLEDLYLPLPELCPRHETNNDGWGVVRRKAFRRTGLLNMDLFLQATLDGMDNWGTEISTQNK